MAVLVTGGAGYIGSHVVRLLQDRGEDVVVVDDMSSGIRERAGNATVLELDLAGGDDVDVTAKLAACMLRNEVTSVVHFAAKKQVGESVDRPLWYYQNNVTGLRHVIGAMQDAGVQEIVFSSSAATYGMPDADIIPETYPCQPINPYGQTKLVGEWMIDNAVRRGSMRAIKLRYFNVAGAGWDDLRDPAVMNLVPIVYDRLKSGEKPVVFGDDYDTPDGTCIRDYVHVKDLADAHLVALDHLAAGHGRAGEGKDLGAGDHGSPVFNVGTGNGSSVKEVIDAISRVIGHEVEYVIGDRRAGDPPRLVADVGAIAEHLGWTATHDLDDMARTACPPELLPR
ncbi:UDP-glucose 4-epimerase GalE [Brevibacterium litoralis]|uniref:UDP-glucose 4-epimerase GalE n=1 Tax=Brevibacterium litoralis TaxID=3138935 RepID=UPI0032ED23DD